MPNVSGPSMPSMPTLSTGTGSTSTSQTTTTTTSKTTSETEKTDAEKVAETKAGYALTAQTISSLSGNSDLSTLSSLLGGDASSLYGNLTGLDSTTASYNTNLLLSQILEKLNKIAEKQGTLETEKNPENVQIAAKKSSNAGILRFRFNNYEYVSNLSDVYISTPEADGTFFVTGDRTYSFGNAQSRETFYMLFKANYADRETYIKGQRVMIKRGQLLRAVHNLAEDWGWSVNKVRRFTLDLTQQGMIQVFGTPYGTLITIENYEAFQDERRADETPDGISDGTPDETPDGTREKKVKKVKNKVKDKIGICLDTCHVYDGGYDIVGNLDAVLAEFDEIIGLCRLKAVHLNDSMNPMGSHKDRHAKIGEGSIGVNAFAAIINHPYLRKLPFYLETPNELPGYQQEIELLKSLYVEDM